MPYLISNFQFRHPVFNSIIHPISEKSVNLRMKDAFICLLFVKSMLISKNYKCLPLIGGWVSSEGKVHLQKWQPKVWNYENFLKGGCYYGEWNCEVV
jgi:hypothetical protein